MGLIFHFKCTFKMSPAICFNLHQSKILSSGSGLMHLQKVRGRLTWMATFISFLNKKVLDWSKLKAFADDRINVNEKLKFGLRRVENIVGIENAGYQHFLLFLQCFQKVSFSRSIKVRIVW